MEVLTSFRRYSRSTISTVYKMIDELVRLRTTIEPQKKSVELHYPIEEQRGERKRKRQRELPR